MNKDMGQTFCGLRLNEAVVFRMSADPEPDDEFALAPAECSKLPINAHRPDACHKLFEMKRWMEGIFKPEAMFLSGEFLDVTGKSCEKSPKGWISFIGHGNSRRLSDSMLASTCAIR